MTADQIQGVRPGQAVDAGADPELANALAALAMGSDDTAKDAPRFIDNPPDGTVTLPGGYVAENGYVVREATVRELCGEDEEELARPGIVRDFTRFIDTILTRCCTYIGTERATREILDDLLIGDRDMLLQAIRVATYGDTMRLDVTCQHCQHQFQVDYSFTKDVPVTQLDGREVKSETGGSAVTLDPRRHVYTIPLRNGRNADVRLINGAIQRTVYTRENTERTIPELNSILLSHCVLAIDGDPVSMADVRRLPSADRLRILEFLGESQPGPQWEEVKHSCPRCEREQPLVIDVPTMFRGV